MQRSQASTSRWRSCCCCGHKALLAGLLTLWGSVVVSIGICPPLWALLQPSSGWALGRCLASVLLGGAVRRVDCIEAWAHVEVEVRLCHGVRRPGTGQPLGPASAEPLPGRARTLPSIPALVPSVPPSRPCPKPHTKPHQHATKHLIAPLCVRGAATPLCPPSLPSHASPFAPPPPCAFPLLPVLNSRSCSFSRPPSRSPFPSPSAAPIRTSSSCKCRPFSSSSCPAQPHCRTLQASGLISRAVDALPPSGAGSAPPYIHFITTKPLQSSARDLAWCAMEAAAKMSAALPVAAPPPPPPLDMCCLPAMMRACDCTRLDCYPTLRHDLAAKHRGLGTAKCLCTSVSFPASAPVSSWHSLDHKPAHMRARSPSHRAGHALRPGASPHTVNLYDVLRHPHRQVESPPEVRLWVEHYTDEAVAELATELRSRGLGDAVVVRSFTRMLDEESAAGVRARAGPDSGCPGLCELEAWIARKRQNLEDYEPALWSDAYRCAGQRCAGQVPRWGGRTELERYREGREGQGRRRL